MDMRYVRLLGTKIWRHPKISSNHARARTVATRRESFLKKATSPNSDPSPR